MIRLALLAGLVLSGFSGSAQAQCGAFEQMRAARIATEAAQYGGAYAGPAPFVILGDSHTERLLTVHGSGYESSGRPVLFAGIAGATWATLEACIPWSALAAARPERIAIQAGVNDANGGVCCTAAGDLTPAYMQTILRVVDRASSISRLPPVLASDPPPEQAAGINPYRVHQMARAAYYAASLDWTIFGWANKGPGPLGFVDQYSTLAGAVCTPASLPYGTPCYAAPGSTVDQVHLLHDSYLQMLGALLLVLPST